MAWIDYRKAFDSVPHSRILKVLDLLKILLWELTLNVILENAFFCLSLIPLSKELN